MQVTLSFQSSGTIPGDGRPVRMVGASMTIGRSADNDLMLADPSKMVSKRHCVLQNMGGDVTVVDYSSNGTFLNYEAARLGGTPTPLKDGDILIVGSYELSVSITAAVGTGQIDGLALPPQMDPLADIQTGSIARAPDPLHDPLGEEDQLGWRLPERRPGSGSPFVLTDDAALHRSQRRRHAAGGGVMQNGHVTSPIMKSQKIIQ